MRIDPTLANTDLYALLGVGRCASPREIRRAYRRLAATSHPDVHRGHSDQGHRMARINVAAGVLLDPCLRALYDSMRRLPRTRRFGSDPWWWGRGRPDAGESYEWIAPESERAPASEEGYPPDQHALLLGCRPWASRLLQLFAAWSSSWSPRSHVAFFAASVAVSCALVGWSHPRSLRARPALAVTIALAIPNLPG